MVSDSVTIPAKALEEFYPYVEMSKITRNVTLSNINEYFDLFLKSPLIKTEEGIYYAMRSIRVNMKAKKADSPLSKFLELCETHKSEENYLGKIKELYINYFFRPTNNVVYYRNASDFSTIRYLMKYGLISIEELLPLIKEFVKVHDFMPNIMCIVYLYFGELLKEIDNNFFQKLKNICLQYDDNDSVNPILYSKFKELIDFPPVLSEYIFDGVEHNSIMYALKHDDVNTLVLEEASGLDINTVISDNVMDFPSFVQQKPTLIQYAAYFGAVKCFKFLFLNGADITTKDEWSHTLKDFAIAGNSIEIVKLISSEGVNFSNSLSLAAQYGRNDIFQWILNTQKSEKDELKKNLTNVLCYCSSSNNPELILYCLRQGISVNSRDSGGYTPLNSAVLGEILPIVKFFIQIGADVNLTNADGSTALHFAASHGYIKFLEYLLSIDNIDTSLKNRNGLTAFGKALSDNMSEAAEYLLNHPKMKENITSEEITNAIIMVAISMSKGSLKFMLDHPEIFDLNSTLRGVSCPPLIYFTEEKNLELVKLMLSYPQINPNERERNFGMNFLQAAIKNNDYKIAEYGLKLDSVDKETKTLFGRDLLSIAGENEKMVSLITKYI